MIERIDAEAIAGRMKDPGPGEHLWIATLAFRISDQMARAMAEGRDPGEIIFDHESILTPPAPGCFKCEQPFSKRLYHRKCTGTMDLVGF
ncbi:MAG: hypothetical protein HOV84_17530 [Streptomyces sp.]|nr:hypothetical protein [Streptomyces sp.]